MTAITVTLGPRPELDPEEARARALRAREVLATAGWVFDELITDLTNDLLSTDQADSAKRESLYHQIYGAAQAKGLLRSIVDQQAARELTNERRHRNDPPADAE